MADAGRRAVAPAAARLPALAGVDQQALRRVAAGVFVEAMSHDRRIRLRGCAGRKPRPSAAILDRRTLQSTPEGGRRRAGYDGAKRRTGSQLHPAVDPLGHRLAAHVPPAAAPDRVQVEARAAAIEAATGAGVEIGYVDQG